ncbi:MAG: prepilin-type N-terminal cleavage/methylation domain-containing protein [Deltaproteobacteria bacterium]|nr:prepilin-type N-terminal cleavage/methylation domain-containing protein [Deltaproteobacteria bacterium]
MRGFSLVELLTGLAIVSIVAAIALPGFSSLTARYQLTQGAHRVAFEVGRARMKAIGENAYIRVRFTNATSSNPAPNQQGAAFWLEKSTDSGANYLADGATQYLPNGTAFNSIPSAYLVFTRQGLTSQAASISIRNSTGSTKTISVTTMGRVTVQ